MHATVRTFRAPDAASALQAVKAALGTEAIILSTREVSGGLFRKPQIEVTAALSDEPDSNDEAGQEADQESQAKELSRETGAKKARSVGIKEKMSGSRERIRPLLDSERGLDRGRDRDDRRPSFEERIERPEIGESAAIASEVLSLKRDLDEARREMRVICLRTKAERDLDLNPAAAETFGRLVNQGVEEPLAEEMVRQVVFDGAEPKDLLPAVRDLVAGRLVPSRAPWMPSMHGLSASSISGRPDGQRVIALVGPTGVGKTTTIAKIAAKALVESELKVALITVDTYRIGASEQLSRYGAIMHVPTHVARDRAELADAIEQSADADLVLIDTAGRAVSEAIARQAEFIRSVPGVQLYLVLSAATGARELAGAAERYRPLAPERLIFSKIDEAVAPGSVLSAAVRINRPVACITDGQSVPEDIHSVTSDELCSLVLGSWESRKAGNMARRK